MRRTFSKWVDRQRKDIFVRRAKLEGYRSRAAYKLQDLNHTYRFLRPGLRVLDLGAAPGGWSQVAAKLVESQPATPAVLAVDLLPIDPIPGVKVLTLDVHAAGAAEKIVVEMDGLADVLLCDMSGNHTGDGNVDCGVTVDLTLEALRISRKVLRPGGCAVLKMFSGLGEPDHFTYVKTFFGRLERAKPDASRSESRELYYFGRNWLKGKKRERSLSPMPPPDAEQTLTVSDVVGQQEVFVLDSALDRLVASLPGKVTGKEE